MEENQGNDSTSSSNDQNAQASLNHEQAVSSLVQTTLGSPLPDNHEALQDASAAAPISTTSLQPLPSSDTNSLSSTTFLATSSALSSDTISSIATNARGDPDHALQADIDGADVKATTSDQAPFVSLDGASEIPPSGGAEGPSKLENHTSSEISPQHVPDGVEPDAGSVEGSTEQPYEPELLVQEIVPHAPEIQLQGPAIKTRLPHDIVGLLEDRIADDPRGDTAAWVALIEEHKKKGKIEEASAVYKRFLKLFPTAAEIWLAYARLENENQNRHSVDTVLAESLMKLPYIPLWSFYLDHVQRHNNLTTDTSGTARQVINSAYDLALKQIGQDKDSGKIWQDYIAFIKTSPGIIGGSNWQDQQKMDSLRKAYQAAICVPHQATSILWKEYDGFEMGLNKITGRKFLQDQSPGYVSARSSFTELQNITRSLRRETIPVLPPAFGFEGDADYNEQLKIWMAWVSWEKSDPLALKIDDVEAYRARNLFVYKHALMALRFWPEMWYDASEFCYENGLDEKGNEFLAQGLIANPESCLLAFKRADRLEIASADEEGSDKVLGRATRVREPYDFLLDALYELIQRTKMREEQELARADAESVAAASTKVQANGINGESNYDDNSEDTNHAAQQALKEGRMAAIRASYGAQNRLLSRTISFAWIALMRALRRIQGKGAVGQGGARGVLSDARKRGRLTSDVYVEAALIEFHCYDAEVGRKIFERGLKLFSEDERFALDYIKHLVANNDHTNARVVFETVVTRLSQKPENVVKTKPLYTFFHDFESRYGELLQISKIEQRMQELFPEDATLSLFSKRFVEKGFDPTAIRPIISPARQTRTKTIPSIETIAPSPLEPSTTVAINSPKRSHPTDDFDSFDPPRKVVRGESPLKIATSSHMVRQGSLPKTLASVPAVPVTNSAVPKAVPTPQVVRSAPNPSAIPPPLPRDVNNLLAMIPHAHTYHATRFDPSKLVQLLRDTTVPVSNTSSQVPQSLPRSLPPSTPTHPLPAAPHLAPPPNTSYMQPAISQRPNMPSIPQMPVMNYPSQYGMQPAGPYMYSR